MYGYKTVPGMHFMPIWFARHDCAFTLRPVGLSSLANQTYAGEKEDKRSYCTDADTYFSRRSSMWNLQLLRQVVEDSLAIALTAVVPVEEEPASRLVELVSVLVSALVDVVLELEIAELVEVAADVVLELDVVELLELLVCGRPFGVALRSNARTKLDR